MLLINGLPQGRISTTIWSVLRKDQKCKYICMFSQINWAWQELVCLLCVEKMPLYLIYFESICLMLDQIHVYCAALSGSGVFPWNRLSIVSHVCVGKLGCNRVCYLLVITGTTSLVTFHPFSSHCNSFEDWAHVKFTNARTWNEL